MGKSGVIKVGEEFVLVNEKQRHVWSCLEFGD